MFMHLIKKRKRKNEIKKNVGNPCRNARMTGINVSKNKHQGWNPMGQISYILHAQKYMPIHNSWNLLECI